MPRRPHFHPLDRDRGREGWLSGGAGLVVTQTRRLFVAFAVACSLFAPQATAATFQLEDGVKLQGRITAAGRRYVTITTEGGARLVARSALRQVTISGTDGKLLIGSFEGWKAGAYSLRTKRGVVKVVEAPAKAPRVAATENAAAQKTEKAATQKAPQKSPQGEKVGANSPSKSAPSVSPKPSQRVARTAQPSKGPTAKALRAQRSETSGAVATAPEAFPPAATASAVESPGLPDGYALGAETSAAALERAEETSQQSARDTVAAFGALNDTTPLRGKLDDILSGALVAEPVAAPGSSPTAQLTPPTAGRPPSRAWARDFQDGVLGVVEPSPGRALSCAQLASGVSPPLAWRRSIGVDTPDRTSLITALGGDYAPGLFASLSSAFFASVGVAAQANFTDASEQGVLRIDAGNQRLAAPIRIVARQSASPSDAVGLISEGRADIALSPSGAVTGNLNARLIAVDAVAIVAEKNNPLRALTRRDIKGLLSGSVSDWSMLQGSLIGAPRLYLPPLLSAELQALTKFADVRRVQPASARYIEDPKQRLEAALADPMGIAVVSRSVLGDRSPIAIGRGVAGAKPTRDAIRQALYPLILPVYAVASQKPAHPAAPNLAAFLSGPAGQRALYAAGLFPVAACDPSTCALRLEGLEQARKSIGEVPAFPLLTPAKPEQLPAATVAAPIARIEFPGDDATPSPATTEQLVDTIQSLAQNGAKDRRYLVVARATTQNNNAATLRAEAVSLALRCAGVRVSRYGASTSAFASGATSPSAGALRIEVLDDPR